MAEQRFCVSLNDLRRKLARDASRVRVFLVSQMSDVFVERQLLTPVSSLEDAIARALERLTPAARIGVMPYSNATIPYLDHEP